MSEQEIDSIRRMVKDMLRRVPARVNNGSVSAARDFKKFYGKVSKDIDAQRLTKDRALSLYNETLGWYQ